MVRKFVSILFLVGGLFGLVSPSFAQEKVKVGTPVKIAAHYYLPVLASEEKGFWRENGLDVEWVPFAGGTPFMHAVAAGAISTGLARSDFALMAADRGLAVLMVAETVPSVPFNIYVKADSPYRLPQDLKGKRVAVTSLGSTTHILARAIFSAHGIEKDVRFIGAGGIAEQLAALRTDAVEGMSGPLATMAAVQLEGAVREVASSAEYVPKPWVDETIFSHKDLVRNKPDTVRRMIRATLQATDFIQKNPRWTIDKMKSFQGVSEPVAKLVYDNTKYSATGKLDRKAVENTRKFYIAYGVITEKTPAVDDLFTNEYLP